MVEFIGDILGLYLEMFTATDMSSVERFSAGVILAQIQVEYGLGQDHT